MNSATFLPFDSFVGVDVLDNLATVISTVFSIKCSFRNIRFSFLIYSALAGACTNRIGEAKRNVNITWHANREREAGKMDKETKATLNYTKEEALSFLCQAMQDETIRLRKARKKERASIRKFLIEAFSVISASNLDTQSLTTNLEDMRQPFQAPNT